MTEIRISRNPYDDKHPLYSRNQISLREGVTVIIGCNGAGKTTLLRQLATVLHRESTDSTVVNIDANAETSRLMGGGLSQDTFIRSLTMRSESEGNRRWYAVADRFTDIGEAVRDENLHDLWILIDGFDSGVDISGVNLMFDALDEQVLPELHRRGIPLHVVMSATTYEPVRYAQEHDGTVITVPSLRPIRFQGYEDWRDWTLTNAKQVEKRKNA